jgi:hypothetical protein
MALTSSDTKTTCGRGTTYGRLITRHDTLSCAFCSRPGTAICNDRPFIVKYNHPHRPPFSLSVLSFSWLFLHLARYFLFFPLLPPFNTSYHILNFDEVLEYFSIFYVPRLKFLRICYIYIFTYIYFNYIKINTRRIIICSISEENIGIILTKNYVL